MTILILDNFNHNSMQFYSDEEMNLVQVKYQEKCITDQSITKVTVQN